MCSPDWWQPLSWLDNNPELKAMLVIDNKGVANTIKCGYPGAEYWRKVRSGLVLQECVELRQKIGNRVEVVWYPSHATQKLKTGTAEEKENVTRMREKFGVKGSEEVEFCNEIADKLAGRGREREAESAITAWRHLDTITL